MNPSGRVKLGRPPKGTTDKGMKKVTFRVDDETFAAIETMASAIELPRGTVIRGRRSVLLRRLVMEAFAKQPTSK